MAIIDGTAGDDNLTGTGSVDTISGLAGNDTLSGLGGDDTLDGGIGDDTLWFARHRADRDRQNLRLGQTPVCFFAGFGQNHRRVGPDRFFLMDRCVLLSNHNDLAFNDSSTIMRHNSIS